MIFQKSQLIQFLKEQEIYLTKKRGQNFLLDKNILQKITHSIPLNNDNPIIEIGGGVGHLTYFLSQLDREVYVYEIDKKLISILKNSFIENKNVHIIGEDFLKSSLNLISQKENKPFHIFSNIPYSLTTPILEKCFENSSIIESMVFTVQKEFGERVIAQPGSDQYSSLSVFCQVQSEVKILFTIPPNAFFPIPGVESALLLFKITPCETMIDHKYFFKLVKGIFSLRRKTLINSLKQHPFIKLDPKKIEDALNKLSLNSSMRGEELSPKQFILLSNKLCSLE